MVFFGYIGLEIAMALFSDVIALAPKVVELEFKKLDVQLNPKHLSKAEFVYTFNNIVKQCLDVDKYARKIQNIRQNTQMFCIVVFISFSYISCIGDLFYYRTLITPTLFTYCIGLTIFCQYTVIDHSSNQT